MSECANCNVSVYVPDGYEFEEGDMCMSCTKQELDSSWKLVDRLGKLLHDTANVLHGGPKENGLWSYHNVPELAEELTAKADRLQTLVSSADDRDGCMMWTSDHDKILSRFKEENNKLRGLLAAGKGDCVYCGLPAADIAKCPSGFPGCARMDDIVNAVETAKDDKILELHLRISDLEHCIRELLKGGDHEGECSEGDLSLSSSWEVGPCVKHLQASETREAAARKLLEETNAIGPKG